MRKIRAYTLMEVTVVMLLSAICISICYSAYGIITNYYANFKQKNQTADVVLSLKHVIERDCLKSNFILKSENGLALDLDSSKIYYIFNDQVVLRKVDEFHTDTFKMAAKDIEFSFEGREVAIADKVDQIKFTTVLAEGIVTPLQINKLYSAENLFK